MKCESGTKIDDIDTNIKGKLSKSATKINNNSDEPTLIVDEANMDIS